MGLGLQQYTYLMEARTSVSAGHSLGCSVSNTIRLFVCQTWKDGVDGYTQAWCAQGSSAAGACRLTDLLLDSLSPNRLQQCLLLSPPQYTSQAPTVHCCAFGKEKPIALTLTNGWRTLLPRRSATWTT